MTVEVIKAPIIVVFIQVPVDIDSIARELNSFEELWKYIETGSAVYVYV